MLTYTDIHIQNHFQHHNNNISWSKQKSLDHETKWDEEKELKMKPKGEIHTFLVKTRIL